MKKLAIAALMTATISSTHVYAQNLTVTITNLTHAMTFTPILVAAHSKTAGDLFDVGSTASANLQAMAEGGALTGLQSDLDTATATHSAAAGMLAAGATTANITLNTDASPANTQLSVVAMLLPTNDGFLGLDAIDIPTTAGTYTYDVNAYDAGTEANNEVLDTVNGGTPGMLGMPGDPSGLGGLNGTGVTTVENNNTVHIHRGAIGDSNLTAGTSDLTNTVHRWLNPVARVTVVVN